MFKPNYILIIYVPIAIESLGPICSDGLAFLRNLGQRMAAVSGDNKELSLLQRLSITLQHFNCVMFKNTFVNMADDAD